MPVPDNKANVKNTFKTFIVLPEDVYNVQVVDVELKEGLETKWGKKDKFYFKLGILDDKEFSHTDEEGKTQIKRTRGMKLMHFVSTAFSMGSNNFSNSKLYDFACAVYAKTLDPKDGINVNDLIGKKLRVVVKHSEKDDRVYVNIDSVMKISGEAPKDLTKKELESFQVADDSQEEVMDENELDDFIADMEKAK